MRRATPCQLFRDTVFGDMYFVTPYDAVRQIIGNPEVFSSRVNDRLIGGIIGSTIVGMDEPDHNQMRKLIMPFFTPRPVGALEDRVREVAFEMIGRLAGRARADLVADFTFTYPLVVFDRLILGVEVGDGAAQFHHWVRAFLKITTEPEEAIAAVALIREYLAPVIAKARRAAGGDTLVIRLAEAKIDGKSLTDEEIMSFLILLLQAGAETTSSLLGSAIWHLLDGYLWQCIQDNPVALDRAFRETLRYDSPVQFVARETTCEVMVGGVTLPRGSLVVAALGSANRDPSVFSDPDSFYLLRDLKYWNDTLAFGLGPHYCAGFHLARLEFMVALEVLGERFPNLNLDEDMPQEGVVGLPFRAPRSLPVLLGI
ncbi:MAG: cytochrome P450 [Patescibacteria group bacterium]